MKAALVIGAGAAVQPAIRIVGSLAGTGKVWAVDCGWAGEPVVDAGKNVTSLSKIQSGLFPARFVAHDVATSMEVKNHWSCATGIIGEELQFGVVEVYCQIYRFSLPVDCATGKDMIFDSFDVGSSVDLLLVKYPLFAIPDNNLPSVIALCAQIQAKKQEQ